MSIQDSPTVADNQEQSRFELSYSDQHGELTYQLQDDKLVLLHVEVPKEIEHQGHGGLLVRAAVERAERDGLTLVPLCPFARWWLEENPGEASPVEIEWA